MKIYLNRETMTLDFSIEGEEDLIRAYQLEKLINDPKWIDLVSAWAEILDKYDESTMKIKPTNISMLETTMRVQAKNGFKEAVGVANKIVKAAQVYRYERKKEFDKQLKEEMNGVQEPEYAS